MDTHSLPTKRKRGQCRFCSHICSKFAELIKHEATHVSIRIEPIIQASQIKSEPDVPQINSEPELPQIKSEPEVINEIAIKSPYNINEDKCQARVKIKNKERKKRSKPISRDDRSKLEDIKNYDWTFDFDSLSPISGKSRHSCKSYKKVLVNKSRIDLKTHNMSHTGERPFSCPKCPARFKKVWNRERHVNAVHIKQKLGRIYNKNEDEILARLDNYDWKGDFVHDPEFLEYTCVRCDAKLQNSSRRGLAEHHMIHTGEKPFRCTSGGCKEMFRTIQVMEKHMKGFHTSNPREFPIKKGTKRRFGRHISNVTNEELALINGYDWTKDFERDGTVSRCKICQKLLKNTYRVFLFAHAASHQKIQHFKCRYCTRSFAYPHNRINHEIKFHKKNKANLKEEKKQLEISPRVKVIVPRSKNLETRNSEPTAKEMRRHIQWYDPNVDFEIKGDTVKCKICRREMRTRNKYTLFYHNMSHSDQRLFKCEICPASFTTRPHRNQHERKKHGLPKRNKRVSQDQDNIMKGESNSTFHTSQENTAKIHVDSFKLTSKLNPYYRRKEDKKIWESMKKFDPNSDFTRAEFPKGSWLCNWCGKKLLNGQPSALKGHLMGHTGEKPYSAKCCGMKFARMFSRNRHEMSHNVFKRNVLNKYHKRVGKYTSNLSKNVVKIQDKMRAREILEKKKIRKLSAFDWRKDFQKVHGQENRFKCLTCSKTLVGSYKLFLALHLMCHKGENLFTCFCCSRTFTRTWNRDRHEQLHLSKLRKSGKIPLQNYQDIKPPNRVGLTEENLYNKDVILQAKDVKILIVRVEKLTEYKQLLDSAQERFRNGFKLKNQRSTANAKGICRLYEKIGSQYHCLKCFRVFRLPGIICHLQSHAIFDMLIKNCSSDYECSFCHKALSNEKTLNKHENFHRKAERFKSNGNKTSQWKMRISKNELKYSDQDVQDLKSTSSRSYPENIVNKKIVSRPTISMGRGKWIRSGWNSKEHFHYIEDPKSGDLTFACKICDKIIITQSTLRSHHQLHTGKPRFVCVCGISVSGRYHLNRHQKKSCRLLVKKDTNNI